MDSVEIEGVNNGKNRSKFEGLTFVFYVSVLTVTFCNAMLCGYNMVVLNTPREVIAWQMNQTYYSLRGTTISADDYTRLEMVSNTLYLLFGIFGSLTSGWTADKFGSKKSLWFSDFALLIGSILSGFGYVIPELLHVGRAITGFGYGISSCSTSTYLAEIAPKHVRGLVGSGLPFGLIGGIVLAQFAALPEFLGTPYRWPFLFAVSAAAALLSLLVLPLCPESPRYLYLLRHDQDGAKKALLRLTGPAAIEQEIREIESERHLTDDGEEKVTTFAQLLSNIETRSALLLSCLLQVGQQMAGSTAVFMYCESIFREAGLPAEFTPYAVLSTGLISLVCILPAMVLLEKVGRKPILLLSTFAIIVTLVGLKFTIYYKLSDPRISYLSVVCVLLFCAAFAFGLGPLSAVIPPELFRQETRGRAYAIAKVVNGICMIIQGALYEYLAKALQENVFLLFAGILFLIGIYFCLYLPETRGQTFEEVQVLLLSSNSKCLPCTKCCCCCSTPANQTSL